jgi:hypothetical protein
MAVKEHVSPQTQSNKGMHPTPRQRASHVGRMGARAMPGVRLRKLSALRQFGHQAKELLP